MLKIIEYSLLAVSLLVVIGLVMNNTRSNSDSPSTHDPALPKESSEAHESGKSA
jgi:hypothetical protein